MSIIDVNNFNVERVYEGTLQILEKIGVAVANEALATKLASRLPLRGNRVYFPREVVEHYMGEICKTHGYVPGRPPTDDGIRYDLPMTLSASACFLNCCWLDPADGQIKPYDTKAVIRNTQMLHQFSEQGLVRGLIAGTPQDVPRLMQYIMMQYINCVYNPSPCLLHIIPSAGTLHHSLEMGEVMGLGLGIGVEMISPLKFMGQSIDLAFEFHKDLECIGIDPLPIIGVTAPADWHMAWSQSVAENLASYMIFRSCGIDNVDTGSYRLFMPNPTTTMTYFSAPQHIVVMLTRRRLMRELFGLNVDGGELLLITSKAPDQQAAVEKMAGFALAKAHGFHCLEGAGGLYLDEIFSPEQLVIDIELKRYTDSIAADFTTTSEDIVTVVEEGVRNNGFLASDLSLERFFNFTWRSQLFDLRSRPSWEADNKPFLTKARCIAEEMAAMPGYELQGQKREALEQIMVQVRKEFGCD